MNRPDAQQVTRQGARQETLVAELERYAADELAAQGRLLEALRAQEEALFHGDLAAIRRGVERFDAELAGAPQRAARRAELVRRLAVQFRVAPQTLTLGSICARLGDAGAGLARHASALREASTAVATATRRLAALARLHVRLNGELLESVLERGGDGVAGASTSSGRGLGVGAQSGSLVDARG